MLPAKSRGNASELWPLSAANPKPIDRALKDVRECGGALQMGSRLKDRKEKLPKEGDKSGLE